MCEDDYLKVLNDLFTCFFICSNLKKIVDDSNSYFINEALLNLRTSFELILKNYERKFIKNEK